MRKIADSVANAINTLLLILIGFIAGVVIAASLWRK